MSASSPKLLVTGAGGQLGRRVVELLLQAGADVVAASRDPSKLADLVEQGAEARQADFDDPTSLVSAFAGVDRLLLISTDALGQPGQRIGQHRAAVAAAVAAGVKHIVYTSAPAPTPKAGGGVMDDHFWTEQAIIASGLDWTLLRHNLYAEVILMGAAQAVASGQLFTATGGLGRSYVTREDCARTDAAALLHAKGRQILDVTGPEAITQDQLAALLSEVSGRPVAHIGLTAEQLRGGLTGAGLPDFVADMLIDFDVAAAQGYHAVLTPTVEALTGRKPGTVRDFLLANKAALG
ncbi:SDR family oxidoreductase [Caulobacter sp. ErkDOM-E]|uniref:SDR family oxidoreductase n=1 Tax=Caulobacter sp. ErkDOM-E TaxID=3402778 RepID=UPI003AF8623D